VPIYVFTCEYFKSIITNRRILRMNDLWELVLFQLSET